MTYHQYELIITLLLITSLGAVLGDQRGTIADIVIFLFIIKALYHRWKDDI